MCRSDKDRDRDYGGDRERHVKEIKREDPVGGGAGYGGSRWEGVKIMLIIQHNLKKITLYP